jgi:branched-chain amino acid transport system substrate-binding protein
MTGAAFGGLTRRSALTGGLGLAAGALLAGCSDAVGSTAGDGRGGELLIGANLELTGVGSTMGKLQEQALKVGADQINSVGIPFGDGRLKVRLLITDNGGKATAAALHTQNLIEQEKVSAIIGGTTVETTRAMISVAESRRVPLLCLNSGDDMTVPLPERKFIYQLGPNASDVASAIARELRKMNLTNVAVLASADGHGEAGVRALPRALLATGRKLKSIVRLPQSGRAYDAVAERIVEAKPKAVIVWAQAPISAAAVAALRTAGYKGRIFLDPGAGADETLGGPNSAAMEGTHILHPAVLAGAPLMATSPSERAARVFIYRYIQQYGAFGGFAPYAADALTLIATAARRGVTVDPQRLRGRLEAGSQEGIAGAYVFQPISHGGLEPDALTLFTARQGAWVRQS